jgi:hypothetical protein
MSLIQNELPTTITQKLRCPNCKPFDGKEELANLKWSFHTHPGGAKSEYLVYYCDICNTGFTTTESDTISLRRYKSKKRGLIRKQKIKNILK